MIHNHWQKSQATQIDGRPAENLIESILSPDGLHRLDAYWNDGSGATVIESSVVIITANENSMKWEGKNSWCLYFSYRYPDITAEWIYSRPTAFVKPHLFTQILSEITRKVR